MRWDALSLREARITRTSCVREPPRAAGAVDLPAASPALAARSSAASATLSPKPTRQSDTWEAGPAAVTQERSQRRRARILDAAFDVFSRLGYRDTAMDEIANQAQTSKGGIYFHFPTKESIFLELMRTTADRLVDEVDRAVAGTSDPVAQADVALRTVLSAFARHRMMARLLLVDALGAGRVFQAEHERLHERFARLISGYLDRAVEQEIVPAIDTRIAGEAWFGALNEIVMRWLMAEKPGRLEDAYPVLRVILLRSVGVSETRIAVLPPR